MSNVKNDNPLGNLWNSMTKEAGRVANEAGRHVTESINDIAKETEKNGFVGGAIAFVDKTSAGNVVAGMVDSIIPGADLPPSVVNGISMGVNAFAGGPGAIAMIIDGFQLLGAATGGAPKAGAAPAPTAAQKAAQQDPAATRMQTPEPPSTAQERYAGSSAKADGMRSSNAAAADARVTDLGGGSIERVDGGPTVIRGSNSADKITVERQKDGSVKVSINGESTVLSAKEAENLIILAKAGKDDINVKGVDGVTIKAGFGDDRVVVEGDNVYVVGGFGNDRVAVDGDNATVKGNKGSDQLSVTGNNATLHGGDNNDVLTAHGDNATFRGGKGKGDKIQGSGRNADLGTDKHVSTFKDGPPRFVARHSAAYYGSLESHLKNLPNSGFGGPIGNNVQVGDAANGGLVSNDFMDIEIGDPGGRVFGGVKKDPKLAKLERDLEKANREIESILNNPNLSFEDLIFLLMRAVIKQSETEVKLELQEQKIGRREDKAARDAGRAALNAEQAAINKEAERIAGLAPDDKNKQTDAAKLQSRKSEFEAKSQAFSDQLSDKVESRNEAFETLKESLQKISEMQQALSNILNSLHQTAQNAIGNIR